MKASYVDDTIFTKDFQELASSHPTPFPARCPLGWRVYNASITARARRAGACHKFQPTARPTFKHWDQKYCHPICQQPGFIRCCLNRGEESCDRPVTTAHIQELRSLGRWARPRWADAGPTNGRNTGGISHLRVPGIHRLFIYQRKHILLVQLLMFYKCIALQ